jgi:hypothetical protein
MLRAIWAASAARPEIKNINVEAISGAIASSDNLLESASEARSLSAENRN